MQECATGRSVCDGRATKAFGRRAHLRGKDAPSIEDNAHVDTLAGCTRGGSLDHNTGGTRNSAAFVTATLGLVPPKSGRHGSCHVSHTTSSPPVSSLFLSRYENHNIPTIQGLSTWHFFGAVDLYNLGSCMSVSSDWLLHLHKYNLKFCIQSHYSKPKYTCLLEISQNI